MRNSFQRFEIYFPIFHDLSLHLLSYPLQTDVHTWASKHSAPTWRAHYIDNRESFDPLIDELIHQNDDDPADTVQEQITPQPPPPPPPKPTSKNRTRKEPISTAAMEAPRKRKHLEPGDTLPDSDEDEWKIREASQSTGGWFPKKANQSKKATSLGKGKGKRARPPTPYEEDEEEEETPSEKEVGGEDEESDDVQMDEPVEQPKAPEKTDGRARVQTRSASVIRKSLELAAKDDDV